MGDGRLHRGGHRAQVDGDMGGLGQHLWPICPFDKEGAAKVEPFFDVGAIGGPAECNTHLLSN